MSKINYYSYINSENIIENFLDMTKGKTGKQGSMGYKGTPGDVGLKGLGGPIGLQGRRGDPGDPGKRGLKGSIGLQGIPGNPGDRGEKGIQGVPGPIGDKGPQGDKGNRGQIGKKGSKGEKGEKGDDGVIGESGTSFSNNSFSSIDNPKCNIQVIHSNEVKKAHSCPHMSALSGIQTYAWSSRIKEYRKTSTCTLYSCTTTTVTWGYRGYQIGRDYKLCCSKIPLVKENPNIPFDILMANAFLKKPIPKKYKLLGLKGKSDRGDNLDNQKNISSVKKYPFHHP